MTVASSTDRATFPGNDATTVFPLPFRFFANSDIQASLVTNATGVLTPLTLGTHYTLSGAGEPEVDGNATGKLTMLTAPTALQSLFVQRVLPLTQPTDIVNQGRFFPEIHENVFDRLTMIAQQVGGEAEGAIRVAVGDPEPTRLAPAVSRANQLLGFDSSGNPIAVAPTSGSASDLALSLANSIDPAKGAGQVGYKGRTVAAKFNNSVNVLDNNGSGAADPTGVENSTAAFLDAANLGTGSVYVPAGTYLLEITSLPSGTMIYGDGAKTIIKPLTLTSRAAIAINSSSPTTFIDDLTFYNLTFQGSVDVDGFAEQNHLLTLNGVRNALVYRCRFIGFRGDGVYVGSGDTGGQERHNRNVIIKECFFDGVNKDNRNAISVIDGDGVTIENNYINRCTRSNMPGAIDIEPNANTYHVVRNIRIVNNTLKDIGGNVAAICFAIPGVAYTTPPTDFLVSGNHLDSVETGFSFNFNIAGGLLEGNVPHSVTFRDNQVQTCVKPFLFLNVHTMRMDGNRFLNSTSDALIGFNTGNEHVVDATLSNNLFYRCGSTIGRGLSVFKATRLTLDANKFDDCGTGASGSAMAIRFNTGTSQDVWLRNNQFTSPTGKTLVAIQKEAAHTFTPDTNQFYGNDLNGLTNGFGWAANEAAVPMYTNEGTTFTIVLTGATAAGVGTYTTQLGHYTKIGKLIQFTIEVKWTEHTGTGQLYVNIPALTSGQLPNFQPVSLVSSGIGVAAGAQIVALLNKDPANRLQIYTSNGGTLAALAVPASGTLYISGSYLSA